jgi:ACT domain-containing protein
MKVHADLRLKDVPGQLVGALEPISANDGNIVGVVHHHDVVMGGRISVNVTFIVKSQKSLEKILETWREREVDVARLSSMFETFEFEYLIIGDLSPSELKTITDGIEGIGDLDSVEIRYSVATSVEDKAAMIFGRVRRKDALDRVEDFLRHRSLDAKFLLIGGLGE